jgi:methanogenic corrinoid protein MtbC1
MNAEPKPVATQQGLRRFLSLADEAIEAVICRFDQTPGSYGKFGARGRAACREDIGYHLEFLRPAVEFGLFAPFLDYVRWLGGLLEARGIPARDLDLSLNWLLEFFTARLSRTDAEPIAAALTAAIKALSEPCGDAEPYERLMPAACDECDAFGSALLRGDQRIAAQIFRKLAHDGEMFLDAELHLVQPAMYRIGRDWRDNRISVAQEHLATATAHGLLAREYASARPEAATGKSIVLAGVDGNQHFLGLRLVADAFELAGWEVRFLGPNTPARSLVEMVRAEPPNVVGLSASLPHHLRAAREAIACLRTEMGSACPSLVVGGLTINQVPPIAAMLGADATSPDARSAVQAAGLMVTSQ